MKARGWKASASFWQLNWVKLFPGACFLPLPCSCRSLAVSNSSLIPCSPNVLCQVLSRCFRFSEASLHYSSTDGQELRQARFGRRAVVGQVCTPSPSPSCACTVEHEGHIISYHITSYHIISYHIVSDYIISYHVMSCHVMSCHVMSCHVMSCYVMSCHVMACHVMSWHVMSWHVMSHVISSYGQN